MQSTRPDQRREAGLRTRARLMDAALELLAQRGEDGVTLRELTDAADANVAAVSYHFGSLKSLCDAAIEYALERYLDAQQEAVSALEPDSSLEALAAAFARPMMSALVAGRPRSCGDAHRGAGRDRSSRGMESARCRGSTGFAPMSFACSEPTFVGSRIKS